MQRLIKLIEEQSISVSSWLAAITGIVLVRTFLENFSTRTNYNYATTDLYTIVHYWIFYILTVLILIVIVHVFSKRDIVTVSSVALFGIMIIFLPPVVDLVLSGGNGGMDMTYLFATPHGLIQNFITLFGSSHLPGITNGIRVELVIVLSFITWYVYHNTQKVLPAVAALITSYVALFIMLALPSFLSLTAETFRAFFLGNLKGSLLGHNFVHPETTFTTQYRIADIYFSGMVTLVDYLGVVCFLFIYGVRWNREKFFAVLKNSRPERVAYYFTFIMLGFYLASQTSAMPALNWLNLLSLFALFTSFYFAWMFAVGTNDLVDVTSDRVTNNQRPLVTGALTPAEIKSFNLIFLLLALVGGFAAGHITMALIIVFTALYYIYSVPPLHLKRFALMNTAIVALCTLTAVLAGFYTVNHTAQLYTFPTNWFLLILVWVFLVANIKDIKDEAGDRLVGVFTLPVIFGLQEAKRIIGVGVVVALALVPLMSGIGVLWYPFPFFSAAAFWFITRSPFNERPILLLHILYAVVVGILLLLYV